MFLLRHSGWIRCERFGREHFIGWRGWCILSDGALDVLELQKLLDVVLRVPGAQVTEYVFVKGEFGKLTWTEEI